MLPSVNWSMELRPRMDLATPPKETTRDISYTGDSSREDPIIRVLKRVNRSAVRVLAVLMTAVILWGVFDVVYVLYEHLSSPPFMLLKIEDILNTFGAFMAVLIAIEIFVNIAIYLEENVIHVKIVMATAMMAIARKVIILDLKETTYEMVFAIAAVVLAMGIGYWLVVVRDNASRVSAHEEHRAGSIE